MKEIEKIVEAYRQTDWTKEKAALGVVVRVEESSYRRIGARMFVRSSGLWTGGISGGCLEGDALRRAQSAINKNEASVVVYDTLEDDEHQIGVGLGCNGRIEVLFTPVDPEANNQIKYLESILNTRSPLCLFQVIKSEDPHLLGKFFHNESGITPIPESRIGTLEALVQEQGKSRIFSESEMDILVEVIRPKIRLICVGDNYDILAMVDIANELGWEIHVAGKRKKLQKPIFEIADLVYDLEQVREIETDDFTALVLMTHDYKKDFDLLKHFIDDDIPYLGLLGPKKRRDKMQKDLMEEGLYIDLSKRENLFSPVGLDLGAETPEEISLSICSEIVSVLRNRSGGRLKNRIGPIHERD
ncbi:MAG: XdhC family protein [Saprospiraceae bacterium]|nr:XdhC family protein [Saprospiraceae bacterium]